MKYLSVEDAKDLPGLKLVLTRDVPGPWSEAAKAVMRARKVQFHAVEQIGGGPNEALVAWTGVRNAPIAINNDEAPRSGYLEILYLAERLGSGPSLLPDAPEDRLLCLGIASDICGHNGLGWTMRHLIFEEIFTAEPDFTALPPASQQLLKDYGFSKHAIAGAPQRACDILRGLDAILSRSKTGYFLGDRLSAADLYWATFSMIASPLPHAVNPMPDDLRRRYDCRNPSILKALTPQLMAHRDKIYKDHIGLPLDF